MRKIAYIQRLVEMNAIRHQPALLLDTMNDLGAAGWTVFHVHEMIRGGEGVLMLYASRDITDGE